MAEHVKVCGHKKKQESQAVRLKDKNFYSESKWSQNAKSAFLECKIHLNVSIKNALNSPSYFCNAMHFIVLYFWIFIKVGQDLILFIWNWLDLTGSWTLAFNTRTHFWRWNVKVKGQDHSPEHLSGCASFAFTVHSCIWQTLLSKATDSVFIRPCNQTHELSVALCILPFRSLFFAILP